MDLKSLFQLKTDVTQRISTTEFTEAKTQRITEKILSVVLCEHLLCVLRGLNESVCVVSVKKYFSCYLDLNSLFQFITDVMQRILPRGSLRLKHRESLRKFTL